MKKFPTKKYNIIYADPPWSYKNMGNIQNNVLNHYSVMSKKEICALPIQNICEDDCFLFLWATFPKIQEALDVIKAWGFEYKTIGFNWWKINKDGSPVFGVGWYTKSNGEICLIGTKGKPKKESNKISQVIIAQRTKHSEKPGIVREKIVSFCGDLPRIELFARQTTKGWDCWGNEV